MLRQAIILYISLLLLVGGFTSIDAETSTSESNSESTSNAREQLIDLITEDYLKLLDYEMSRSRDLFQNVLDDDKFQDVRSEILLNKMLVLKNFIEHIGERQMKKIPPKEHKPARFFHVFGKSLLYKEFISIVARLEPNSSRYDRLIEDAVSANGIEKLMSAVDKKRRKLIGESVQRIEEYVNGLPTEQRRKAAAQKLADWAMKMRETENLSQKMEIFREFLRYEYLEAAMALNAE